MQVKQRNETPVRRVNPSGQERWVARYTAPDGRRLSAGTFKLKRDAQAAINAAYIQPVGRPRDTVGAYAATWTKRRPRSARTNYDRDSKLRQVLDVQIEGVKFRDWPLVDLRRWHGNALVDHMLREQGRAVEGTRNILRVLSVMCEDAIDDELLEVNPFRGVKFRASDPRVQKPRREPRIWTPDQMHRFAGHAGQYEPMIRMLADCGLRVGELLALQRDLQDLNAGVFTVKGTAHHGKLVDSNETKNHDRQGPIPPTCLALLRKMPVRIDSPWLFPSPGGGVFDHPGGELWRYENFRRRVWIPTQEAAGINPTAHEFRHSWVSYLRAGGIDGRDLADIAGHSEAVQNRIYHHPLRQSYNLVRQLIG